MRERFPSLDADDVIQETLIAVWAALPSYRYVPEEKGYFHNYLTGILRNKALRQLHKEQRQAEIAEKLREDVSSDGRARSPVSPERSEPRKRWLQGCVPQSAIQAADEQAWRVTLVEIALQQLMSDESIQSRTRQVFLRVVVNGEKPEAVAAAFGITCNGVYLIKNRMMPRLQKIVAALEKAGNI